MTSPVATSRTAVATRPSRKLQWLTVVVGFLFFVLLLVEGALLVLGSTGTAVQVWAPPATETETTMLLIDSAAALVLGGLVMLLAGACIGRYRALVKLSALLLFLGAGLRLALPIAHYTFAYAGVYTSMTYFDAGLSGPWGEVLLNLHWYAMVPALLLTLLGLLGLVLFAPKRVVIAPTANDPAPSADDPAVASSTTGPRPDDARADRPVDSGTRDSDTRGL